MPLLWSEYNRHRFFLNIQLLQPVDFSSPVQNMADLQSKDNKDNDNTVDVLQHVPTEGGDLDAAYFAEVDDGYLRSSWTTKFYRGVLFQMILFGA